MPTVYKRLSWKEDDRVKVSPQTKGSIRRQFKAGRYSLKELSEKYGVNYWTVIKIIYNNKSSKVCKSPNNTAQVARLRAKKKLIGKAKKIPAKAIREAQAVGLNINDIWEDWDVNGNEIE